MSKERPVRLGLILDGTDRTIKPIEADLNQRYRVRRFSPHFVRVPLIGSRVNELLLEKQIRRFVQENDVVFCEWAGPLAAMVSCLNCETKRVVRAHRTEIFTNLHNIQWSSIDKVIFVSQAMRTRFLQEFPDEEDRSVAIHFGIRLDRFRQYSKPFDWRIGMLNDLIARKRIYEVICALSDLPADVPWQLFVGGGAVDGELDYWDALQGLVCRLGLGDRVHFAGRVTDTPSWLRKIDVCVSASFSEGNQASLMEAMASGCYCLSHCWDGAEEMLPAENIFTTDRDLRAKLLAYAALPESEKQQAQARMRAIAEEKFDEQRMVREILEIVEEAVRA